MNPFISIVIPNFNGTKFLEPCLKSIFSQVSDEIEVIIVDNGSKDDSIFFIETNYKDVIIISLKKNFGFSKAVNKGIKRSKGEFVFLLNNDTVLEKNCLLNLITFIKNSDNEISCFQTLMLQLDNPTFVDSAGIAFDDSFFAHQTGLNEHYEKFNKSKEIFGVCAGAAVYKKEMLNNISFNGEYFDEDFFAFYEDVDISLRVLALGLKSYLVSDAIVYHAGSKTKIDRSKKLFLLTRNRLLTIIKNRSLKEIIKLIISGRFFDKRSYDFYKGEKRLDILISFFYGHLASLFLYFKFRKKRAFIVKKCDNMK